MNNILTGEKMISASFDQKDLAQNFEKYIWQ